MSLIEINKDTCIKCGICVKVCPIFIVQFDAESGFPTVKESQQNRCVVCGHCEAACASSSLTHELLDKAQPIGENTVDISSQHLSDYFRNRRSIRNYISKPVEKELLEKVMDVVRYAPTGTNSQMNQWILVLSPEKVKALADGTIAWMRAVNEANPAMGGKYNFTALVRAYENGVDVICRNAPHLAICYTAADYGVGIKDATIATAHLELLLPSFGLGACWGGFLMIALQNSPQMRQLVGLDETSMVHSVLMLGYPKYEYYKIPQRKESSITWL